MRTQNKNSNMTSSQTSTCAQLEDKCELSERNRTRQNNNKYKLTVGQHGDYKCERNHQSITQKRKAAVNSDKDTSAKRTKRD